MLTETCDTTTIDLNNYAQMNSTYIAYSAKQVTPKIQRCVAQKLPDKNCGGEKSL